MNGVDDPITTVITQLEAAAILIDFSFKISAEYNHAIGPSEISKKAMNSKTIAVLRPSLTDMKLEVNKNRMI